MRYVLDDKNVFFITASANTFNKTAVELAVIAHVRYVMTNYDELLSKGYERFEARGAVNKEVFNVLVSWQA